MKTNKKIINIVLIILILLAITLPAFAADDQVLDAAPITLPTDIVVNPTIPMDSTNTITKTTFVGTAEQAINQDAKAKLQGIQGNTDADYEKYYDIINWAKKIDDKNKLQKTPIKISNEVKQLFIEKQKLFEGTKLVPKIPDMFFTNKGGPQTPATDNFAVKSAKAVGNFAIQKWYATIPILIIIYMLLQRKLAKARKWKTEQSLLELINNIITTLRTKWGKYEKTKELAIGCLAKKKLVERNAEELNTLTTYIKEVIEVINSIKNFPGIKEAFKEGNAREFERLIRTFKEDKVFGHDATKKHTIASFLVVHVKNGKINMKNLPSYRRIMWLNKQNQGAYLKNLQNTIELYETSNGIVNGELTRLEWAKNRFVRIYQWLRIIVKKLDEKFYQKR